MLNINNLQDFDYPVTLTNLQGSLLWVNNSAEALLSLTESILGETLEEQAWQRVLTRQGPLVQGIATKDRRFVGTAFKTEATILITWLPRELVESDKSLFSDQLSQVIHDLKNPLGALFGYSDTLLETPIGESLEEQQRQLIRRMRGTATRAIDLVKNYELLFFLEKKEAPNPSLSSDLNKTVELVLDYSARNIASEVTLVKELEPNLTPILMDRISLERLVSNLVNNAVKYTPPQGKIRVTSRLDNNSPVLEIANTNVVIPEEEQSKVFLRSYRGNSSRGQAGTGLGLFIVKSICEHYQARIHMQSNQEAGTVFTVRFSSP